MNARSAIAAALLLATLAGGSACDHHDHPASYPVEATYAAPGPYPTTETAVTSATGTVIYKIFRPASYGALGFTSPIVTWGDGTWGTPDNASVFLRHLASYGFTVIGADLANTGSGREIDAAAHYLVTQDGVPGSAFYGHLNVAKVAAVGTSQGAGGAGRAASDDPALITTVETFSLPNRIWAAPNPDCPTKADCGFDPATLTQPAFFIGTHGLLDTVIASAATERAFFRSTHVHAALGIISRSGNQPADHTSIATNPGGFLGYATAWLEYQLRGDAVAASAFTGPHPELVSNDNWPGSAVR